MSYEDYVLRRLEVVYDGELELLKTLCMMRHAWAYPDTAMSSSTGYCMLEIKLSSSDQLAKRRQNQKERRSRVK